MQGKLHMIYTMSINESLNARKTVENSWLNVSGWLDLVQAVENGVLRMIVRFAYIRLKHIAFILKVQPTRNGDHAFD